MKGLMAVIFNVLGTLGLALVILWPQSIQYSLKNSQRQEKHVLQTVMPPLGSAEINEERHFKIPEITAEFKREAFCQISAYENPDIFSAESRYIALFRHRIIIYPFHTFV